jgi:hypothetical protein
VDLDALAASLEPRSRALLAIHPHNPTGSQLDPDDLASFRALARERGLALLSDEVFAESCAPGASFRSLLDGAADGPLHFVLSGASKLLGLPQLKVAWIAVGGPPAARDDALARLEFIADAFLSVSPLLARTLARLLPQREALTRTLRARVAANRAQLAALPPGGPVCALPGEAGWAAILSVRACEDDEALAGRLLEETGVLVQPGSLFDLAPAPGAAQLVVTSCRPDLFAPLAALAASPRRSRRALVSAGASTPRPAQRARAGAAAIARARRRRVPDRGRHPPHLAVAALAQRELEPRGRHRLAEADRHRARRQRRRLLEQAHLGRSRAPALDHHAVRERAERRRIRPALHLHPVRARVREARCREAMGEAAVVREQQQALAVVIEAADRPHAGDVDQRAEPGMAARRREARDHAVRLPQREHARPAHAVCGPLEHGREVGARRARSAASAHGMDEAHARHVQEAPVEAGARTGAGSTARARTARPSTGSRSGRAAADGLRLAVLRHHFERLAGNDARRR